MSRIGQKRCLSRPGRKRTLKAFGELHIVMKINQGRSVAVTREVLRWVASVLPVILAALSLMTFTLSGYGQSYSSSYQIRSLDIIRGSGSVPWPVPILQSSNQVIQLTTTSAPPVPTQIINPPPPASLVLPTLADSFASGTVGTAITFSLLGTTAGATREPSEPRHNFHTNGASVWLNWQAPANGRFTLTLSGQTNPVVMAVYTGATFDALTLLTNNVTGLPGQTQIWQRTNAAPYWLLTNSSNHVAQSLQSSNAVLEFLNPTNAATYCTTQLVFNATAGQTYRIAFDGVVVRSAFTNPPVLVTTDFNVSGDLSTFTLQSPVADQVFLSSSGIPLALAPINVSVDGTITQVDYFSGTNWIGSATAPFAFAWSNAPVGFHTLRAVATNAVGDVRVTPPVTIRVLPANDLFATAATLSGNNFLVTGDLGGATRETGEPTHSGNSQGKSLWWKWTPTADGDLSIATTGSVGAVSLSVYTGSQLDQLSLVASNIHIWCSERCGCGWRAQATGFSFGGSAGQTYYIAVDQHADFSPNWFNQGPPLSAFGYGTNFGGLLSSNRVVLFTGSGLLSTNRVLVLTNSSPSGGVSGTNYINRYPPDTQPMLLGATESGAVSIVLRASIPSPVLPAVTPSAVQLAGNFVPSTAANDRFANSTLLTLASNAVAGNNLTAGKEAGEPWHGGKRGGRSVWYSWTAPKSGHVWLSTNVPPAYLQTKWTGVIEVVTGGGSGGTYGSSITNIGGGGGSLYDCGAVSLFTPPFTPVFGVYTGNSVNALTTVAGGNNLLFPVSAGTTYRIAVDEAIGQAGNFNFYLVQFPTPANDLFANRITMIGTTIGAEGNNVGATTDAAGPANSVWWQWTALSFGQVNLSLANSDAQFPVTVYKGTNLNALTPVAAGIGGASFLGKIGTTYQIAIGSRDGFVGNYRMALTAPPVVISPASVIAGGSIKYLLGFPGTNGQFAIIQRQAIPGAAWTNVVFSFVTNGMANHSSLPTTFPSWENYRALLFEGPMTLPRAQAALSGLLTNGNYRLALDGVVGLKFRIKTSTNLIDWVPVSTNTFTGDAFNFLHAAPSNAPAFYYMAEPLLQ